MENRVVDVSEDKEKFSIISSITNLGLNNISP